MFVVYRYILYITKVKPLLSEGLAKSGFRLIVLFRSPLVAVRVACKVLIHVNTHTVQ